MIRLTFVFVLILNLPWPLVGEAQRPATPVDLTSLSIEDLLNIEVTSVARKKQRVSETASAIHVITQEDIRRSGLTTLPEVLRMAPGMQVGRFDAHRWSVTARGFPGAFSNKMLVLIDGRTVYTPLFSGVYWEVQDTLLEDIERIEVIRGPGATMWGANAVNGVINIITKPSGETQGALFTGGAGNEEQGSGGIRFGGRLNPKISYRLYSKYFNRRYRESANELLPRGDWSFVRGGFRVDWDASPRDSLSLRGDTYDGRTRESAAVFSLDPPFNQSAAYSTPLAGGNATARWNRRVSDRSDLSFQLNYDHSQRNELNFGERRDTVDADFQHRFGLWERHELLWGGGYRLTTDDFRGSFSVALEPPSRDLQLFSGFLQDEIDLLENKLLLSLGSKLEHNDFTGFEVQPNLRVAWLPTARQSVWAAVSRAVRTPSRGNHGLRVTLATFPTERGVAALRLLGSSDFESEDALAYELGYRIQPRARISFDIATFYNKYRHLSTLEQGTPFFAADPKPHLVLPLVMDNKMDGEAHGAELAATWGITDRWKITTAYSRLKVQLRVQDSSRDGTAALEGAGQNPEHQFQARSYLDLPWELEFDTALYWVDSLPSLDVPSYGRVDARLGWRPSKILELSFSLQNLLDRRHLEFVTNQGPIAPREFGRTAYGRFAWRF